MDNKQLRKRTRATAAKIAAVLGLRSPSTIFKWHEIPTKHLVKLEREFGIPREKLRPDLYTPRTGLIHKEEEEEAA